MAERISGAEHEIMEVLWRESPLTAAEVAERAPAIAAGASAPSRPCSPACSPRARSAMKSRAARYLYRPAIAREDYVAGESRRLLDRLFGGRVSPLVAHLAERDDLTAEDVAEIEALLKALKP